MLKIILLLVLFSFLNLFAKEYMTQINPIEKIEIRSQSSGEIKYVNEELESNFVKLNQVLIEINSKDEELELQKERSSFSIQKEIVKIKAENYQAKNRIKGISRYEKSNEKLSFLESKKELVLTQQNIKKLQNEISKKVFRIENRYISTIFVKKDEYVNIGDKLFDMYNISNLKITLYLTQKEIKSLVNKNIFIDGVQSDFKIYKINKVKDEIKVSRYKVDFIMKNKTLDNYFFNEIVKVEIK